MPETPTLRTDFPLQTLNEVRENSCSWPTFTETLWNLIQKLKSPFQVVLSHPVSQEICGKFSFLSLYSDLLSENPGEWYATMTWSVYINIHAHFRIHQDVSKNQ